MKIQIKHKTGRPIETNIKLESYTGKGIYDVDSNGYNGKFYIRAGFGYAYFATPITELLAHKNYNSRRA